MATDPKSPRRFEDLLAETTWLGRLAAQLVPPADRDDLVQDVLVSAMRTERPKHLRGWLRTVARNLAARTRSKEQNRRSREETVARSEGSEPSVSDALEAFASHHAVVTAVMELDEPYRTAVLLRFWEDLPPREVARRTGVPVETARTRIKRGVDRLRARLDQQWGGRSAWVLPLLEIGGIRDALLSGSAAAETAATTGTMASLSILTGALAMKKAVLVAVAVASIVATVAIYTYGDVPVDREWPAGAVPGGSPVAAAEAVGAEAKAPATDRTALEDVASGATDAGLVVKVLDRFGKPLEGASVWQWRDLEVEEGAADGTKAHVTDARGRVLLPSVTSAGGVVVLAKDHVVTVCRLASLAGEHEVRLDAGARVQGWIRVDGKEAVEPIPLRLEGQSKQDLLEGVPARLREAVEMFRRVNHHVCRTTAHGAFEFTGLGEDWRGGIRLPMYLWLRGECLERSSERNGSPRYFGVPKPQAGLQVDTTALPGVRGRVVWDDTGEGVAKPSVHVLAVLPSGKSTAVFGVWNVDEEGNFRVGFGPSDSHYEERAWANATERAPLRQIKFWVSKDGSRRNLAVDPAKLDPPGQVEVRLKRAIRLHYLAVDPEGRPVPGAVLEGMRRSQPSGEDGRGTVEVKEGGRRRFLAAAPGHLLAEVEARAGVGTVESPLEVVLPKGNKVVVVVKDPDGRPPRGLHVSVRAKQPLFTGSKEGRPTPLHAAVGTGWRSGTWNNSKVDFNFGFPLDEAGQVVLGSLRPEVPFQLALLDGIHQDVLVQDTVSPTAEEIKRIELRVEEKLQDLEGLVVDDHDRPIGRVQISVSVGGHGNIRSTDAHGRFCFEDVYPKGEPVRLELSARGYVRTEREGVVITKGMAPLKVRMPRGHDVKVTFVDPEGKQLPVMWCGWHVEGGNIRVKYERLEPGILLLKDLPGGSLVLRTRIGGRRYELKHDPVAAGTVRWQLPAMGRIQVEVPRPRRLEWHEIRAVITAQSDGRSFQESFMAGADEPTVATRQHLLLPGRYKVWIRAETDRHIHLPARDVTIKTGQLTLCRFERR